MCVKRFKTTSTLDQHLLEEHQVDDEWFESLNRYVRLSPKQRGICVQKLCSSQKIRLTTEVVAKFF